MYSAHVSAYCGSDTPTYHILKHKLHTSHAYAITPLPHSNTGRFCWGKNDTENGAVSSVNALSLASASAIFISISAAWSDALQRFAANSRHAPMPPAALHLSRGEGSCESRSDFDSDAWRHSSAASPRHVLMLSCLQLIMSPSKYEADEVAPMSSKVRSRRCASADMRHSSAAAVRQCAIEEYPLRPMLIEEEDEVNAAICEEQTMVAATATSTANVRALLLFFSSAWKIMSSFWLRSPREKDAGGS
mmetsp:Transcript_1718/g.1500  ORF Transcript_1718/g.1500 Transcript_1718/m.1500 type:complete len:247 (-) Transcript_1718:252-992(-)